MPPVKNEKHPIVQNEKGCETTDAVVTQVTEYPAQDDTNSLNTPKAPEPSRDVTYSEAERFDHNRSTELLQTERFSKIANVAAYEDAIRNSRILKHPIAGVEIVNRVVYWVIYDDPVIVRIPFEDAYVDPPTALLDDSRNIRDRRSMMEESIDYLCPFVPLRAEKDEDTTYVYASRVQAVWRDRVRYFGKRPLNPTCVGDVVEGVVMSVKEKSVRLYVRGYEVQLDRGALTHRYFDNLRKHYSPGDIINVKVMSLHDPGTGAFAPQFDPKECEREEFRKRIAKRPPSPHMSVVGTVVTMKETTNRAGEPIVRATLWLDALKLPGYAVLGSIARISDAPIRDGTRVKFRLAAKPLGDAVENSERCICAGTIVDILRSSG